ncbi:hypothetical protein [Pendulispora albinea]|uniref:Uncharacterized protein n=1 Tax=Pendulispora albinea TaxID=2741071 RepID=A0ABZ2MBL4_9BACT
MSTVTVAPARVDAVSPDYCLARWNQFYIDIWRVNTTMAGLRIMAKSFEEFTKGYPEGVGVITIVEPGAPLPPAEARQTLGQFLADAEGRIRFSAVVYEGGGFRASAVRGVVSSLILLARPPYPHRVFATATEACTWFQRGFGAEAVNGKELEIAIADLRRRIAVRAFR